MFGALRSRCYTVVGEVLGTMSVTTYEAIVENGQVKLPEGAAIPDHTRVYVVVPSESLTERVHMRSPRLAHPSDVQYFAKKVDVVTDDAHL